MPGQADSAPTHASIGFIGSPGDSVKLTAHVETIIKSGNGMRTYLLRDVASENMLEWSSARRYSISVGETLKLSGTVAAHERRGGQCITRLRNCFNPMRVP